MLIARTGTRFVLEDRHALESGLGNGLGVVTLQVSGEHYRKLLR